jgi:hypothetical protein
MRLWHLLLGVFLVSILLAISREPVGRVAIVVFLTGLGELVVGLTAVMMLFQTIGAIGNAEDLLSYVTAIGATLVVLVAASVTMNALFWIGAELVQRVVP